MKNRQIQTIFVILLLSIFLSACSEVVEKGLKPSDNWSRGVPVANSVGGAIGVYVTGDGKAFYLTWPEHTIERTDIHVQQLDENGAEVLHQRLEVLDGRQRIPRLTPATGDKFHLFWLRRPPRENYWELWHALLDMEGEIVREPILVSTGDINVGSYDIAINSDGSVYLVCDCGDRGGILGIRVESNGAHGEWMRLTAEGSTPSIRKGQAGDLHMTWFQGSQLMYGQLTLAPSMTITTEIITTMPMGTGDSFLGPRIGLTDGWIYILWSTLSRSGLEAGSARTEYIAFPKGNPAAATQPERILILPAEEQPYRSYSGIFSLSQLVRVSSVSFSSEYVYEPVTAAGEKPELAVALVTNQNYRQDILVQPAIVLFEEGRLEGYTIAGKTLSFSRDPALVVDERGNLHVAWREGAAGDEIFYATTALETKAALDQFGGEDLVSMLLRGGLEGFATVLLFPIALPWLVPGFLIVGTWKLLRDRENLESKVSRVILVIAIVAYQITKVLFIPTVLTYVPFSAWIDVPGGWNKFLLVFVPLLIIATSLLVAEVGRRRNNSTILYYALFSISDMVLTMSIYGVNFLGVI